MLDPHIQHQLDFAINNCQDDLGYVAQFLNQIEPGSDKETAAVLILSMFAKHFPYCLEYVVDDLRDSGAEDVEQKKRRSRNGLSNRQLDDATRLKDLQHYDRIHLRCGRVVV